MKILVTGGRDYGDRRKVYNTLAGFHQRSGVDLLIEGGATGADSLARDWCLRMCVPCLTHPANWDMHGRAAGPKRNKEMLKWEPDLVVAFPGGRGTASMVKLATEAGIDVVHVEA